MGGSVSLTVAFVGTSDADDSLLSVLEREYDVSVKVVESEREGVHSQVDCVVGDRSLFASADDVFDAVRDQFPAAPVVVLSETGVEADEALRGRVDRCVQRGAHREETAAALAAVLRDVTGSQDQGIEAASGAVDLLEPAVDTLQDVFFVFDLDGTFRQWNSRLTTVTGYDDEDVETMSPTDFVAPESVDDVASAIDEAIQTGQAQVEADFLTADGERIPYEFTGSLLRDEDGDPVAICGIGRDITDRQRREQALERQAERLETLNHVNAVIRDVNSALVRASSREVIEQAVCEHLVGDTPYRFAWVGDIDLAGVDVEPRAWAGVEDGYFDERLDGEPKETEITAATAIHEGVTLVSQDIAADIDDAAWRSAALDRGYRSVAAIPLSYREASYGVLCVYAPRVNAFGGTERAVLDELGETIAYAISTVEQRRALVTDTVVELDLSLSDEPFFVAATAALDCTLTLEGATRGDGDSLAEFVSVEDVSPQVVADFAEEHGGHATVVTDYDDAGVLRVTTPGPSLAEVVADRGGVLRDATAESGVGTVRVEFPQATDVRSVVRGLQAQFPSAELRATRERERTSTRGLEFREAFDSALTERQREVLETAYLAGYFEWPRGSTAEEVAETVGVTAPTFHEHLRRIQQKLFDTFFETNPPTVR